MVVGANTREARLEYWQANADAVVSRETHVTELLYILERLCFRQKVADRAVYQLCDALQLYPSDGVLYVNTKSHQLRKKEAQLLSCLIVHKNMVVNKQMMCDWIWGMQDITPTQTTIEVYIARLRKSLGEYAGALETVRGLGYRFNAHLVEKLAAEMLYPRSVDMVHQKVGSIAPPAAVYQAA